MKLEKIIQEPTFSITGISERERQRLYIALVCRAKFFAEWEKKQRERYPNLPAVYAELKAEKEVYWKLAESLVVNR